MARLKEIYQAELAPRLMKDLQLKNVMEAPRLEKIIDARSLPRSLA